MSKPDPPDGGLVRGTLDALGQFIVAGLPGTPAEKPDDPETPDEEPDDDDR